MARRLGLLLVWMLAAGPPMQLHAQTLPDDVSSLPWTFDGGWPFATTRIGSVQIFGGTFKSMARRSHVIGPFGVFDATSAQLMAAEPRLAGGRVKAVVSDGEGGWFLGGYFLVDGTVQYLVRIDAAGRLGPAPVVAGASNIRVGALARSNDTLYIGGTFSSIGGRNRTNAAAIGIRSGNVLPWSPVGVVDAEALHVAGSYVLIGGASRLVRVDGVTGASTGWQPDVVGVSAIAVSGTRVFAGGRFSSADGVARSNFAAFDGATGSLLPLAPDPTYSDINRPRRGSSDETGVLALAVSGSTLYLGGTFELIGGARREGAAAIDFISGTLLPWAPMLVPAVVHSLAASTGQVYVGGEEWRSIRGFAVKVDGTTGAESPAWQPKPGDTVYAMATDGPGVAVGGSFTTYQARGGHGLAAVDMASGRSVAVPFADGNVYALAAVGRTVYFGGQFFEVNRQSRAGLAAFDLDAGLLTAFNPALSFDGNAYFPATVLALAVAGTDLFAGGQFDSVGGQARNSLAAVDLQTGAVRPFAPFFAPVANVRGFAVAGGRVWAWGDKTVDNAGSAFFAVLGAATGATVPTPLPAATYGLVASESGLLYGPSLLSGLQRIDPVTFASQSLGPVGAVISRMAIAADDLAIVEPYYGRSRLLAVDLATGTPLLWSHIAPFDTRVFWSVTPTSVFVSTINSGGVGAGWPTASYERRSGATTPAPVADAGVHVQGDLLTVRWTPSPSGALPTAYRVVVGSRPGASDLVSLPFPRAATGFTTAAPSGAYFLRVVAQVNGVDGPASPDLAFVVGVAGCATPPLNAPALRLTAGAAPTLEWSAPEGVNVTGYELRVGWTPGDDSLLRLAVPASQLALSTAGAPPGIYHVAVVAVSACGMSVPSNDVQVVVVAPGQPAPPANLGAQVTGNDVRVTWTAPGGSVTGYVLESGSAPGLADIVAGFVIGPTPSLAVPGAPQGRYHVRVRALNGALVSAASNEIVIDVP